MLAIPISRISRDYIMLFRREWIEEIKWGGDPAKAVEQRNDGVRLSPRKSFAAFASMTRGEAALLRRKTAGSVRRYGKR